MNGAVGQRYFDAAYDLLSKNGKDSAFFERLRGYASSMAVMMRHTSLPAAALVYGSDGDTKDRKATLETVRAILEQFGESSISSNDLRGYYDEDKAKQSVICSNVLSSLLAIRQVCLMLIGEEVHQHGKK